MRVKTFINDFRSLASFSDVRAIARRMFVTNSFDTLLTVIGVDVGGFSPNADPRIMAMSIIGGGVAMGVFSGFIGIYLSERAERLKEVRELEKKLARSLRNSVYWRLALVAPLYVAAWSSFGVLMVTCLVASPYILAGLGLIGVKTAFLSSVTLALALTALLGLYLGRISGEGLAKSAFRALSLGVGGVLLVLFLKKIAGIPVA
ncbi:hypothetical protein JCM10135_02620 [Stetteria hydrogenophila]